MALKLGKNFNIHLIMFIFTNNLINYVYFYVKKCVYFYMHLCVCMSYKPILLMLGTPVT